MKLDELMAEYRDALSSAPLADFEALITAAANRRRRRMTVWAAMAAAACLALWAVYPKPEFRPVTQPAAISARGELPSIHAPAKPAPQWRKTPRPPPPAPALTTWGNFVALAETSMLPDPGVIQLLRVRVSRDRLSSLGVIPPGTGDDFEIPAQVLLGDDGMARAIRVAYTQ